MAGSPLADRVVSRRKAHGLTERGVASVDFQHLREAERRAGVADHPGIGATVLRLANAAVHEATDALQRPEFMRVRGLCILAALDGYALADLLVGPSRAQRLAFKSRAVTTRFEKTAVLNGAAMLAGPYGDAAKELVEGWARRAPPLPRDVAVSALAGALAAGALLFVKERALPPGEVLGFEPVRPPKASTRDAFTAHLAAPAELLRAVFADVQDDAPRRVLADWLSERGDPRGELISLQCALGRGTFGSGAKFVERRGARLAFADRREHEAAEKRLLQRHEKRWLEPLRPYLREWGFRRGFVERVVCDFGRFLDGLDALGGEPIERARLTGYHPALLKRVHQARPHPTLWLLDLSRNRLDATDLELTTSGCFSRVRALDLWGNRFGDAGALSLARRLPDSVERLGLSSTELTDSGVAALAKAPLWRNLTHLSLASNRGVGDGAIAALASATSLEWLDLSACGLTDAGAQALARLELPRLAHLSVRVHEVRLSGARALVASRALSGLTRLELPADTHREVVAAAEARFGAPAPPGEAVFFYS